MKTDSARLSEIFRAFLFAGLTSFGGPIAHLAYFRAEFVQKRKWLSEADYADLVALCQFLPGPASSQVGFALGLQRGGLLGACIAWATFTLPAALVLMLFALGASELNGLYGEGLIHGLKLVAVAVVAQAVWSMGRTLCPDIQRISIALAAIATVILLPTAIGQLGAILLGALSGFLFCRSTNINTLGQLRFPVKRFLATICLILFFVLLFGLPVLTNFFPVQTFALFGAFYRTGALVFGGGHVVLPLLEARTVATGWVNADDFLAGYGAAQAIPGPLFTFAAYLGMVMQPEPKGLLGALICLMGIFLPGMLLVLGVLPFWDNLRRNPKMQRIMAGANAAVVGILAAALYHPLWISAIFSARDFALACAAFALLTLGKAAPWKVVIFTAAVSVMAQSLG